MKRVGLTGGIASGKTTVANIFSMCNIPIYNSDQRAKYLIQNNTEVKEKIIHEFGPQSYLPNGSYNVAYISNIVFSDPEKRNQLNQIVHPAVYADQEKWFEQQHGPYAIVESALLVENHRNYSFDFIITVAANDDIRVERIMKRDNISREEAQLRLQSQLPQSKKIEAANFVIWNNGDRSVIAQVIEVNEQLSS